MADQFTIKDSGERAQFASGMVRDVTADKTDYGLVLDGPMFKRWAEHLRKGAIKYAKRNWMKANGSEERERFRESALRHFLQWYWGNTDEDHASAVFFNINGKEYVDERLRQREKEAILDVRLPAGYHPAEFRNESKFDNANQAALPGTQPTHPADAKDPERLRPIIPGRPVQGTVTNGIGTVTGRYFPDNVKTSKVADPYPDRDPVPAQCQCTVCLDMRGETPLGRIR